MAGKKGRQTSDAVEILHRRFVEGDAESEALLEEFRAEAEVARTIYRLRSEAKLTQQALADRVGTTASVISRLEDADYTGHSLAMLRRIATAPRPPGGDPVPGDENRQSSIGEGQASSWIRQWPGTIEFR